MGTKQIYLKGGGGNPIPFISLQLLLEFNCVYEAMLMRIGGPQIIHQMRSTLNL